MVTYGTSAPGAVELAPGSTNIIRAYNYGQLSGLAAGTQLCLSDSAWIASNAAALAAATHTSDAIIQTAISHFKPGASGAGVNLRDDNDHFFAPWHEPDNNAGMTSAIFNGAMTKWFSLAASSIAAFYTHTITFGLIFTGEFFGSSAYGPTGGPFHSTPPTNALRDTWIAGCSLDWIGSDPYNTLSLVPASAAYATHAGLPWAITEVGYSVGSTVGTDTQQKSHLQSQVTSNNGFSNPAFMFLYFDNDPTLLHTTMSGASLVHATSITVPTLPGANPSSGAVFATNQTITIDPHGANPETVTTTAVSSGTGPYTLHVPSLSFPHASGAVVWLMPLTIAYLRAGPPQPGGSFTQSLKAITAPARKVSKQALTHALQPTPYPAISAASSDFEDGTVGAWVPGGSNPPMLANSSDHAFTGTRSMIVTLPAQAGSGFLTCEGLLTFNVPGVGQTCHVSIRLWVPADVPGVAIGVGGQFVFSNPTTVTGAWTQAQIDFDTDGPTETIAFWATDTTTAGQFFYVDFVQVTFSGLRSLGRATTAARRLTYAPGRTARAAVGVVARVVQAPARALINGGAAKSVTVLAVETVARKAIEAAADRVIAATTGHTTVRSAIAASVKATKTVAGSASNIVATLHQSALITETLLRRVQNAVASSRTVTQAPARSTRPATAVTSSIVEAPSRIIAGAVTARRPVVETPAVGLLNQLLSFFLTARATTTTVGLVRNAAAASRTAATSVGRTARSAAGQTVAAVQHPTGALDGFAVTARNLAVEAPARLLGAGIVPSVLRAIQAPAGRIVARVAHSQIASVIRGIASAVNVEAYGNQVPDDYTIRLGEPAWSISVDTPTWTARA